MGAVVLAFEWTGWKRRSGEETAGQTKSVHTCSTYVIDFCGSCFASHTPHCHPRPPTNRSLGFRICYNFLGIFEEEGLGWDEVDATVSLPYKRDTGRSTNNISLKCCDRFILKLSLFPSHPI